MHAEVFPSCRSVQWDDSEERMIFRLKLRTNSRLRPHAKDWRNHVAAPPIARKLMR